MIAETTVPLPVSESRIPHAIRAFWQTPVTPVPLACFRIGLSLILLVQAFLLVGHLGELHGRHGIVDWSVTADERIVGVPDLAWLEAALAAVGAPGTFAVPLAFATYVGALLGLLLGRRTRLAAVVACLFHAALMTSGQLSTYGVDSFAHIGLFYCIWLPVGYALSVDAFKKPGFSKEPGFCWSVCQASSSFEARLGLRVLQLHVCIAYVASGIEKGLGEQWWNGEAIWRALMSVNDGGIDCSFLATVPWLARVLGWMTLLLEAGVPLFVWHPRLRRLWLIGIVGLHLGIALILNLWVFSATMIVFDVAAFGLPVALQPAQVRNSPSWVTRLLPASPHNACPGGMRNLGKSRARPV